MQGAIDDFQVRIEYDDHRFGRTERVTKRIRVVIRDSSGRVPASLSLCREELVGSIQKSFGAQDIRTGDPSFDDRVLVRGQGLEVAAILSEDTRRRVLSEIARGTVVRAAEIHSKAAGPQEELVARVRELADFGARLQVQPGGIPAMLSRNALHDSVAPLRLRNLILLQEHFGDREVALLTDRALLEEGDLSLRVQAARHLEEEGMGALESLFQDDAIPQSVRLQALHHLASHCSDARLASMQPALLRCLDTESVELRVEAAQALGRGGDAEALKVLIPLAREAGVHPDLRRAAQAAIADVHARLGDMQAGRLSLTPLSTHEGSLSLSNDAGKLSMADAPPGDAVNGSDRPPALP